MTASDPPVVLVPAGAPIAEAAGWVGGSCWLELDLHRRLTDVLSAGAGPGRAGVLWTIRAHRAETAGAWHRRLPELRELPRADFVTQPADVDAAPDDLTGVRTVLAAVVERYRAHRSIAVGPADGPTAETLEVALARAEGDLATLDDLLRSP